MNTEDAETKTPVQRHCYPLWRVGFNFKDGGSTWWVFAFCRSSAIAAVKQKFTDEFGWDGAGDFFARPEETEEGRVFGG